MNDARDPAQPYLVHEATLLHGIKKNARNFERPKNFYQKLVNFAHHWPNRFAALTAK